MDYVYDVTLVCTHIFFEHNSCSDSKITQEVKSVSHEPKKTNLSIKNATNVSGLNDEIKRLLSINWRNCQYKQIRSN